MSCSELKGKIIEYCNEIFRGKQMLINEELKHLSEAIEEDTKSSAGDKYETGREMANLEKAKLHIQAVGIKNSLATLTALPKGISPKIDVGSLVQTNKDWIHLSISLGQLKVEGESVLVISPMAPLAQLLMGKEKGESVTFRENDYQIVGIC